MKAILLKKSVRYLLRIFLVFLTIAGLLLWLTSSDSALQWSAGKLLTLSDNKLTLQGVRGSLHGPLHIEALSYETAETRYEVRDINLNWTPRSLLRGHLHVSLLSVHELKIISLKPSTEKTKLPASLQLPLTLSAPEITLDRLVLVDGASEQVLKKIHAGFNKSASQYKLTLHSMNTGWGTAEADMLLGVSHPYPVTAHAIMQQQQGWIYNAEADASGNLELLVLKANIMTLGGKANGAATLAPFADAPIVAVQLTADGINPAQLRKDMPVAALSAAVSMERQAGGKLKGSLKLHNTMTGAWDKLRLPIRDASARLSGSTDKMDLHALHLDFGKAGEFNGNGKFIHGLFQLDLNTSALNPHALHSKLRQMRLAGNIKLKSEQNWQELSTDLRDQRYRLHLAARHQDNVIQLKSASLQSATGSLTLTGKLALDKSMPFQLAAALKNMNPADFGAYPAANINASLAASGTLAEEAKVALEFSLAGSHFRQQPLAGHGSMRLSASRLWDSNVMLQLGHNHVEFAGELGNTNDQLKLTINSPRLDEFDPELRGQVLASGVVQGSFAAPAGKLEVQIDNLKWRNHFSLSSLKVQAEVLEGPEGQMKLDASLQDLAVAKTGIAQASLTLHGTRLHHVLNFNAKNSSFAFASRISGSLHEGASWSGFLEEMSNQGELDFSLQSPAKLELARQRFELQQANFEFGEARLKVQEIAYNNGHLTSMGTLDKLPLGKIINFTDKTADVKADLALSGNWQVDIAEQVNGHLAIWRDSGDITLPAEPPTTLGLDHLSLKLEALNNHLQAQLEARGSKLGSLQAEAQVMLTRRDGAWGIAGNSPLAAHANLSVESLAWLAPLINSSGTLTFDGALKAAVHAEGSFAQPQLSGTVAGSRLIVELQNQGLRFTEGSFQMNLRDQALLLEQFSMKGGGGHGSLAGHGRLTLDGESPAMQLSLTADKLEVLSQPDRLLILSGTADASTIGKKLQFKAKLVADQGLIELPKDDTLTSSDDVTVLGDSDEAEQKGLPYDANFELDLDLGERFYVKGKGLDAQLGGTLKLTGKNGALPLSRGSIHVIKGSYTAYGQRLVVERGIINFQGPLDNPGLNIIAMRKNQAVEAGVAVTGTAQQPRVKLVSNPNVQDSEKLSWLVLGYGLENSSGKDFNALNAAAGALLSAGESITLQQKIARASGFEDVSLKGSGELNGTVLSLGKRLSSRAYLNYEQGLNNASSLVKINYTLSKRLSVQAQAGSTPAIDLFYTFKYD